MSQIVKSLDEQAADMANLILAKGGGMPDDANGGLSGQAGGTALTAKSAKKSDDDDADDMGGDEGDEGEDEVEKAAKTGANVNNEPGRMGRKPRTGSAITSEPGSEEGSGADVSGDQKTRARKPGKVGVPGQSADGGEPGDGGNLDQDDDQKARGRKAGRVGISKGEETIDADALIKSLETLEAIAQGSTIAAPADRRAELAEKLSAGTLSKSEQAELHSLTAEDPAEDLAKSGDEVFNPSFQEQFATDDELAKGYEVSDFLERHSQVTAAALDQIQTTLAKSLDSHRDRTQQFNVQLAKSLQGMATLAQSQESLIKSLAARLDVVESTPLPRKGATTARALSKSLDGEVGNGGPAGLTRSQLLDGLESMAKSGLDATSSGHPVMQAIANLESGGPIAKSLYQDVANHLTKGR